ncbi:MAG: TolC family protein [Muribaculaceae bacterium]|nr:TolC family protein [Muribaculaceae bacterium]
MRKIFASVILALFILPLSAETPQQVALNIISDAPSLKSVYGGTEAEIAALKTIANLPDPGIEGEYLVAPKDEDNRWGFGVNWELDWPGAYKARKNAGKAEAERLSLSNNVARNNLLTEVRKLILDYILLNRQIALIKEIKQNADSVASLTQQAMKGGELTLLDINKIKIENSSLDIRLLTLEDAKKAVEKDLSVIAGKDCSSLLKDMDCVFPATNLPSPERMKELAARTPEILEAEAASRYAAASSKVATMEGLPSLSIGYKHAFEDGMHFNGGALDISIPIFSNKGKRKAAKAAEMASNLKTEELRLASENNLHASIERLNALSKRIEAVAPLIEDTNPRQLLLNAYSQKVITLIDYLSETNYYMEAGLELLSMRHAAANIRLDIFSIIGE